MKNVVLRIRGIARGTLSNHSKLVICAGMFFLAGFSVSRRFTHQQAVYADANRVYELVIYHALPGKGPSLESVFRDVSKQQTEHNLNVLGYWVPNEDPAWKDTFIYVVVHPSREAADANWNALHADPAFLPYRKAAEPLIERANGRWNVDQIYMRPSDFSPAK